MKINSLLLISLILFSRVSTQNTNSINASLNTAKFLEKKGDIDGAISIYQGILEKNPKHAISIHKIKSIYLSYERYYEGIQFVNNLLKNDPLFKSSSGPVCFPCFLANLKSSFSFMSFNFCSCSI